MNKLTAPLPTDDIASQELLGVAVGVSAVYLTPATAAREGTSCACERGLAAPSATNFVHRSAGRVRGAWRGSPTRLLGAPYIVSLVDFVQPAER